MSEDLIKFDLTDEVRRLHKRRMRRRVVAFWLVMALQAAIVGSVYLIITGQRLGKAAGLLALEAWALYLVFWMVRRS
jgi:hypothetical protein